MFTYGKPNLFYVVAFQLNKSVYNYISLGDISHKIGLTYSEIINGIENISSDVFYTTDSRYITQEFINCYNEDVMKKVIDYLNSLLAMKKMKEG